MQEMTGPLIFNAECWKDLLMIAAALRDPESGMSL